MQEFALTISCMAALNFHIDCKTESAADHSTQSIPQSARDPTKIFTCTGINLNDEILIQMLWYLNDITC
jgi:hypothetical protein